MMELKQPDRAADGKESIDELLSRGFDALQRGHLEESEASAKAALGRDRKSYRALQLLGLAAAGRGDRKSAIDFLSRAITADKTVAQLHYELGNLFHDDEQIERAIGCYRKSVRLDPGYAEAYNDLGTALHFTGDLTEAIRCYRRAVELVPEHEVAYGNLGEALKRSGQYNEARKAFQKVLKLRLKKYFGRVFHRRPDRVVSARRASAAAHTVISDEYVAAESAYRAGRRDEAERICRSLLASNAKHPDALHLLGLVCSEQGRADEAHGFYSRAIAAKDSVPEYHVNFGNLLRILGRLDESAASYRRALWLNPAFALAYTNLGTVLREQGRLADALAASREAVTLDPSNPIAHSNLGAVLIDMGRLEEAGHSLRAALEINPETAEAISNLALVLRLRGRFDEALEHYRRARDARPDNADFNLAYGLDLLSLENWTEGWDACEWRKKMPGWNPAHARLDFPHWEGSPLKGKHLLVYGEQDLGHEILFASCLPEVVADTRRSTVICHPKLKRLMERSFPSAKIVPALPSDSRKTLPRLDGVDFQAAAGSLPRWLRRTREAFPPHRGYLVAEPGRVEFWKGRLERLGAGPKIGVCWHGDADPARGTQLDLARLAAALPRGHFVGLQASDAGNEIEELARTHAIVVHCWREAIDDIDEAAALLCALDLTVSVCSDWVHLCGALGKPVLVIAPVVAEWCYGVRGSTMPWYPSARVLRQDVAGDWSRVFSALPAEIERMIAEETGGA
jgi:tetratricopeptide (TPR) repeat protein